MFTNIVYRLTRRYRIQNDLFAQYKKKKRNVLSVYFMLRDKKNS